MKNYRQAALLLIMFQALPNTGSAQLTDRINLQDYLDTCKMPAWLAGEPQWDMDKLLVFGPMRERTQDEAIPGVWKYTYTTEDKQYPEAAISGTEGPGGSAQRTVSLSDYNNIWVTAAIPRPTESTSIPEFLWLGLSVPRAIDGFSGQINHHGKFRSSNFYNAESELSVLWDAAREHRVIEPKKGSKPGKDVLVYLLDNANSDTSKVDSFWRRSLSKGHIELVERSRDNLFSRRKQGAYEHFFNYMELPRDRVQHYNWIKGHRQPAMKEIKVAGTAFAYLVDSQGSCLASASIEIVD